MSARQPDELRRIVTGTDEHGRSTFTEGPAPRIVAPAESPGVWIAEQWVTRSCPVEPTAPDIAGRDWELEPPPGGTAFRLFQLPPRGADGSASTLHVTATIDYVVILSGALWLVLDTGDVELGAGDCVIQRGTPHAWENRSSEPCVAAAVLVSTWSGEPDERR